MTVTMPKVYCIPLCRYLGASVDFAAWDMDGLYIDIQE
jgi:hypothetical protein